MRSRLRLRRPRLALRAPWRGRAGDDAAQFVPVDPRAAIAGELHPDLVAIRRLLRPHGRRLWLRRIVRRGWIVLAAVVLAELVLWTLARFMPIEIAPTLAAVIPLTGRASRCSCSPSGSRPSLGETAIAVDREGGLGDRAASALALAVAFPDVAGVDAASDAGRRGSPPKRPIPTPSGAASCCASGATRSRPCAPRRPTSSDRASRAGRPRPRSWR